jgi:hypothetical protein
MSIEVDILPIADDNTETARLADLIEGVAGEFSPFEELHGFGIDGVDLETSALPEGWRGRLVKVQNANTDAPSGEPQFTGWCLVSAVVPAAHVGVVGVTDLADRRGDRCGGWSASSECRRWIGQRPSRCRCPGRPSAGGPCGGARRHHGDDGSGDRVCC